MLAKEDTEKLTKQHYRMVGEHSAVKLCHWLRKSLKGEGACYKQRFYGIESHRCLQMTPTVGWCTQSCIYCWRNIEYSTDPPKRWDDPEEIVDGAVKAQRILLTGFGGIPERIDQKKYMEAQDPNQVAISLGGEPTLYPYLSDLIDVFHRRDFTTFLVSNGTLPEKLSELDVLPTQLYVSLTASNKRTHDRLDAPLVPDAWEKINESLELLPSLDTKTVVRLTLVKGWNMEDPKDYAPLIEKADPDFIEAKAYMFVGGSRQRMTIDNMPSHADVRSFSEKLAGELSYKIKDEKKDSRVLLLVK